MSCIEIKPVLNQVIVIMKLNQAVTSLATQVAITRTISGSLIRSRDPDEGPDRSRGHTVKLES